MKPEAARAIVDGLKASDISFLSFLPESRLNDIIPLIDEDKFFTLVRASHEGTAVSMACGAALTGKRAAAYMEGTGFILSLYHQLGVSFRRGVPVLLLVAYVGSPGDRASSITFSGYGGLGWGGRIEPLLNAVQIPYKIVETADDIGLRIEEMERAAQSRQSPACLLFTGDFTIFTGGWT